MAGVKVIYLEEVVDLLRAGVPFDQVCARLGVEGDSVITNLRRAERRGAVRDLVDARLIRSARRESGRERYDAAMARRRDVTMGIQSR